MDIKTAMALRNYGINPSATTQYAPKFSGFNLTKTDNDIKSTSLGYTPKTDFSTVLKNIASESVGSLQSAEQISLDGLGNKADIQAVVEAMAQAEMTVKTITAVRDKVVEAYQEILRMPV